MFYDHYESLEIHFSRSHFMCPYDSCRQKCYVAFQTESELQAHLNITHTRQSASANVNANALLGFTSDAQDDESKANKRPAKIKH